MFHKSNQLKDELSSSVAYYKSINTYNKTDGDLEGRREGFDQRVMEKVQNVVVSFGLCKFSQQIAFSYLQKILSVEEEEDKKKFARLRQWVLMLINKQLFPPTISPWQQKCPGLIPGLRSIPVWQTKLFKWVKTLEGSFLQIKQELLHLKGVEGFQQYRAPSWASSQKASDGVGSISHDAGDWNVFYLFLHNIDFTSNCSKCPITTSIIKSIDDQYDHAFFSALSPDTHITKHHGPTNKKLRCHLPLIVPKDKCCTLRVGDETVIVEEGKCFIFDDSFEHEAWNSSKDESRIVLIVDIWHPDLHHEEKKFLKFIRNSKLRLEKKNSKDDDDNFFSIIEQGYKNGCHNNSFLC